MMFCCFGLAIQAQEISGKVYHNEFAMIYNDEEISHRVLNYLETTNRRKYLRIQDSIEYKTISKPLNKFKIYLLKKQDSHKGKRIYCAKKSNTFDIKIKPKYLKKYHFLEIVNKKGSLNKVIKLDTIDRLKDSIILDLKPILSAKPVIYLYPEQTMDVSVKVYPTGKLLNTYPKYENGWNVTAHPTSKILNKSDERMYDYLFWDALSNNPRHSGEYTSGFYVKNGDYIDFLHTHLEHIGLNPSEINDFVSYWLPELNKNEMSFIHFRINEEANRYAKLEVYPRPDTELRVYMEFYGLSEKGNLPEQTFQKVDRKGFTVVEWGGSDVSIEEY